MADAEGTDGAGAERTADEGAEGSEDVGTEEADGAGRVRTALREHEVGVLVGPPTLWFLVFLVAPLLVILAYSVFTYESFNVLYEFSLSSWENVASPVVTGVYVRTVTVAAAVTVLTLVFGYPLAYYLRFHVGETTGIFLLLLLIVPFWTSGVIRTIGWLPILSNTGVVNQLLLWSGLVEEPVSWLLFSPFSQAVGYLQNYVVFMAAPIYISLSQIDEDLLDASATLRGGPWATFRHVTVPLSMPGVIIGAIFVFVLTVGNFTVPQFLSGGTATVTSLIYLATSSLNYPDAAAMSIGLLVVIFGVVYLLTRVVDITDIGRV